MVWPAIIAASAALAGGLMNRRSNESAGNKNADLQKDFAQKGISWRVADAKRAGLHPLAALGSSGASASPSYVGDTSMGSAVASAGQDISRAVHASSSSEDRGDRLGTFIESKLAAQTQRDITARHENREDLRLQSSLLNDEVQRQYYAAQIARLQAAPNPPLPIGRTGSGGSGSGATSSHLPGVKVVPDEVTSSGYRTGYTAGTHSLMTRYEGPGGIPIMLPSKTASEALEGAGEIGGAIFGTLPSITQTGWEWAKLGYDAIDRYKHPFIRQYGKTRWYRGAPSNRYDHR